MDYLYPESKDLKVSKFYNTVKQKVDLKAAAQTGIVIAPLACKGVLKITRGGALLPPPLKVAVVAVPLGIKLAVMGYGLCKAVKAASVEQ